MRRTLAISLTLCTLASLTGCAGDTGDDPDSWQFPAWGSKSDELGTGLTITHDASAQVFDGYNHVVDASIRRACVLPEDGGLEIADFRAGGDVITTELAYLTSRKQLEQAIGIDAQAKLGLGPLSGSASFGLNRSYSSSERTVSILLRARHTYTVINQQAHELVPEALATLERDPAQFTRECGTDYIAGVAHGAELVMLVQIESSSLDKKMQIESKLAASGIKAGPASIDASLGTKFSNALAQEDAKVAVFVESRGFVPSVDLAQLSQLDGDAFGVAAEAAKQLRASVELDKCHDQGDGGPGTCGGVAARGYLGNGARVAVPMGILRQQFQRTGNFPSTPVVVNALLETMRAADKANAVIEDYAELYDAVLAVHADEAGAMTSSDRPFDFGIYDTTPTMREDFTFSEWGSHASEWADVFEPMSGDATSQLVDALQPCWSRAQFGDFSECAAKPEQTEGGQALLATFAEYAEARVRPVFYANASFGTKHDEALGSCPKGWRLPTKSESNRLWYAIENNPDLPAPSAHEDTLQSDRAAWYDDVGKDCSGDQGSYIERLADGTFHTGCYSNAGVFGSSMRLPAMCVPKSGLWGTSVPKLPS